MKKPKSALWWYIVAENLKHNGELFYNLDGENYVFRNLRFVSISRDAYEERKV